MDIPHLFHPSPHHKSVRDGGLSHSTHTHDDNLDGGHLSL